MERSLLTALIGGLLGIITLGGLAFVGSAPGSLAAPVSRPEGDWRLLDPVTYENISVFPVVSSYSLDTSPFLTLEEGLSSGEVIVSEQGGVELVSGGKQDRVIGKDRIVPVGAPPLPLDVFCVEHGRWTGGAQFAAANTIVHPSVRESAAVDQVQTKVWESVRNGTNAKGGAAGLPPQISSRNLQ